MKNKTVKAMLMSAVVGLGVWGILQVETEEATATVNRTFALHDTLDGTCLAGSSINMVAFTHDNGVTDWTVQNNAAAYDDCQTVELGGDTFYPFSMVDINAGSTRNVIGAGAGVGWDPSGGDHAASSIVLRGSCYATQCDSGDAYCNYTGAANTRYLNGTGDTQVCLYTGEFNN